LGCRCEASIAKLAGDISVIRSEAHKTEKEIYGLRSALKNCVSDFEKKVSREAYVKYLVSGDYAYIYICVYRLIS